MKQNMKTVSKILGVISASAMILTGCSKSGVNNQSSQATTPVVAPLHVYGLQAPDPARYSQVPVYVGNEIYEIISNPVAGASGPEPATYTLPTPAVRNQEQIGSCTGFCGSEANEIIHYFAQSDKFTTLSPLYLYYIERVKIQKQKITVDEGAQMVDIPEALQGYGQCIEADYAYPNNNIDSTATSSSTAYKTAPNAAAISNALGWEIGAGGSKYGLIAQGDTATVKSLLRNNIPVCMGFNVYDNSGYTLFEGLNTTSYTYNPLQANGKLVKGASLLGGHANIIAGYNNTLGVFYMENSWGSSWGDHGYWYLPYSVFQSSTIVGAGQCYWMSL